jgi:RNA polymerase sigma factor (sigma-70 family)
VTDSDHPIPATASCWSRQDNLEIGEIVRDHLRQITLQAQRYSSDGADYEAVVGDTLRDLFVQWHTITGSKLAWCMTVARNKAIDANKRYREAAYDIEENARPLCQPTISWEGRQHFLTAVDILKSLPDHLSYAALALERGLSVEQIAAELNCTVETTRTYISRTRKALNEGLYPSSPPRFPQSPPPSAPGTERTT